MVSCLEKTEENAEFHQTVDFLSICSINYALTVSPTIYASYIEQFWNTAPSKTINSVKQIHAIVNGKVVVILESLVRSDLLFNDEDGIVYLTNNENFENLALIGYEQLSTKLTFQKGGGNSVERAITTAASLVAAHDSDNILKTQSTAMSNDPLSHEISSGDNPMRQETMGVLLLRLEDAKTAQDRVITRLKLRVKRLEKKRKARTPQPMKRSLFKGRVESFNDDLDEEDVSKQGRTDDKTKPMFVDSDFDKLNDHMENVEGETVNTATTRVSDVSALVTTAGVAISTAEPRTPPSTAATAFIDEDLTIAKTLVKIRSEKAKVKGIAFSDVEEILRLNRSTTTLQPLPIIDPKDKELAQRLHEEELAELDIAQKERQKQEEATSADLAKEFDEIQAIIDADHELAVRLTHEEQEKYTIEERTRLLTEFFERRKKQLAAESAEAIRNKPPT
ncbi:hypothetical protein Tco_0989618 [Tanacetum coccineum]|uniref:Xylulose kinase-1 n=1 Tax=Tanacetum coccineum TaxID=301880 RepID=A0ABQ5EUU2_9ASTR